MSVQGSSTGEQIQIIDPYYSHLGWAGDADPDETTAIAVSHGYALKNFDASDQPISPRKISCSPAMNTMASNLASHYTFLLEQWPRKSKLPQYPPINHGEILP
ncbi:hypothetical protein CBM2599_A10306 [Cupriavidus taiwanensis]|nr:hypothetical protein CBM2599_A10306 [Cupriavidus taiwanensis]SOY80495.1 hypothetical protein CBM2600_A10152 [Cupriavidus taiwanensis]